MATFIRQLAEKEGFDLNKIIALGYSNGANIAGSLLLLYPGFLSGAILYRPMQPFRNFPEINNAVHTPVFMSNGLQDPTINPEDTLNYVKRMEDAGFKVSQHNLPYGHNLTPDDLKLSVDWYAKNF
jgi:phospholipase/carboxylesterase